MEGYLYQRRFKIPKEWAIGDLKPEWTESATPAENQEMVPFIV